MIGNEAANAVHRLPRVAGEVLRPAMFLLDRLDDGPDRGAMSVRIVRRQRRERIIMPPELPRGEIEFALDADQVGLGGGQDLVGRQAGIEFQFQLLGELLFAQPPLTVGPRTDFLFEKLLIVLQAGDDPQGSLAEGIFLRRFARQLEDLLSIEIDRTPVLRDGRLQDRLWRTGQRLPGGRHDPRDLAHACNRIAQVGFLGQRQLGQQHIDAAVDVVRVPAGIFFEGPGIFVQPQRFFQVVLEDLEIDLAGPRKAGVIDLPRQIGQCPPGPLDPLRPRFRGKVFQLGVEAMVAQARRIGGLLREVGVEIAAEKCVQFGIFSGSG